MRKVYLKLTVDQKNRGVIFSSILRPGNTLHEVFDNDPKKHDKIKNLLDDKFFNGSQFKRNEIRQ